MPSTRPTQPTAAERCGVRRGAGTRAPRVRLATAPDPACITFTASRPGPSLTSSRARASHELFAETMRSRPVARRCDVSPRAASSHPRPPPRIPFDASCEVPPMLPSSPQRPSIPERHRAMITLGGSCSRATARGRGLETTGPRGWMTPRPREGVGCASRPEAVARGRARAWPANCRSE
jgi:hypothetical protein